MTPAQPSPPGSTPAPTRPLPDIVIITVDTLRADHLGYHGYFRDTSPHIDRLAQESLRFMGCLAPMATTLPTHTTLLTGVWPNEHGVLANVKHGGKRFKRSEELFTVAEYLKGVGYHTAAFVSGLPLKRSFGLGDGFDSYSQPPKHQIIAAKNTARVLAWLEQHNEASPKQPFFLWVHYFDPHNPYEAPGKFARQFDADQDPEFDEFLEQRRFAKQTTRPGKKSRLQVTREIIDDYDGEIAYTDSNLGRLLDALRERPRWPETLIVFTADHGEGLGQHGIAGHGQTWNEQLHIPLLMRIPGIEARDIHGYMSLADVLPTLFGLVELPDEQRIARQFSGRDVLTSSPRAILSQTSERQEELSGGMAYSLVSAPWKLTRTLDGHTQLYHLERDPFELADVSAEHSETRAELEKELDRQLEAQSARAAFFSAAKSSTSTSEPEMPLSQEELEGMRALGYMGDE